MTTHDTLSLTIQPLEADAFAAYGWMLGKPLPKDPDVPCFRNAATDFYQEHVFNTGGNGEPEILWVNYRGTDPVINTLEAHRVTEQAIVPLTDEIFQIVATSGLDGLPDLASLRAFNIPPGQGICMRPGCWHATRVRKGQVTCMMLTRRSTTIDLIGHLAAGKPLQESVLAAIPGATLDRGRLPEDARALK